MPTDPKVRVEQVGASAWKISLWRPCPCVHCPDETHGNWETTGGATSEREANEQAERLRQRLASQ